MLKTSFMLFSFVIISSCANSEKRAERDRQNIFFAEFYYEQGFPGRSLSHARKIKPDSPHYADAQEWIGLANESAAPEVD